MVKTAWFSCIGNYELALLYDRPVMHDFVMHFLVYLCWKLGMELVCGLANP